MDHQDQAGLLRKLAQADNSKAFSYPAEGDVAGRKSSPLIDRSQNPVRPPGAPAAPPVPQRGARSTGLPVPQPGEVDATTLANLHRHEGDSENVQPYFHSHPHDRDVRHDPGDPEQSLDDPDHLNDLRHVEARRWYGAKFAGADTGAKILAVASVVGDLSAHLEDRDFEIRKAAETMYQEDRALLAGLLQKQARSTVRKSAQFKRDRPGTGRPERLRSAPVRSDAAQGKVAEIVKEAKYWQEYAETCRDFHERQYANERVKAAAAELRNLVGLDDDAIIRKFAERL